MDHVGRLQVEGPHPVAGSGSADSLGGGGLVGVSGINSFRGSDRPPPADLALALADAHSKAPAQACRPSWPWQTCRGAARPLPLLPLPCPCPIPTLGLGLLMPLHHAARGRNHLAHLVVSEAAGRFQGLAPGYRTAAPGADSARSTYTSGSSGVSSTAFEANGRASAYFRCVFRV